MSVPSNKTRPPLAEYSRGISDTSVLLPEPVPPMMPSVSPLFKAVSYTHLFSAAEPLRCVSKQILFSTPRRVFHIWASKKPSRPNGQSRGRHSRQVLIQSPATARPADAVWQTEIGCTVLLSPGFVIGHTPRKFPARGQPPPASSHILCSRA